MLNVRCFLIHFVSRQHAHLFDEDIVKVSFAQWFILWKADHAQPKFRLLPAGCCLVVTMVKFAWMDSVCRFSCILTGHFCSHSCPESKSKFWLIVHAVEVPKRSFFHYSDDSFIFFHVKWSGFWASLSYKKTVHHKDPSLTSSHPWGLTPSLHHSPPARPLQRSKISEGRLLSMAIIDDHHVAVGSEAGQRRGFQW